MFIVIVIVIVVVITVIPIMTHIIILILLIIMVVLFRRGLSSTRLNFLRRPAFMLTLIYLSNAF